MAFSWAVAWAPYYSLPTPFDFLTIYHKGQHDSFGNDHTIKCSFRPSAHKKESNPIILIERMPSEVHTWRDCKQLMTNTLKTELIYFGSRQHLSKYTKGSIQVIDDMVVCNNSIKYLGAWLDQSLSLHTHAVKSV